MQDRGAYTCREGYVNFSFIQYKEHYYHMAWTKD